MEREINGTGEEVGLLVLEAKSLRPFKTKDEYLYAMKEDLAEWFKCLYEDVCITAENFLEVLETGVLLCQHANEVRKFVAEQKEKGDFQMKSNFVRNIQIPQYEVQFRIDVKPETFLARDNVSNFITWTVKMGIPEVLRFETDDLVLRKNERSVVLCLLEVARVGAKFGMLAPTIVQMEEEIDEEIATGEPPPQIKTCDIKSLDEMVRELVGRCTCPIQFPIIKVGEGKYKIGDSQTLVFVRILRKHVMIRVGGGWDTLEHYLDRHDPCRCSFQGHRQVGRGPVTPRRSSIAGTAQTQMNTPRTPRRSSVTSIIKSPPAQTSLRDSIRRSVSPEVNSKKTKRSYSQPGSAVTSPDDSVKSFSGTEHFTDTSKSSRVPYVSRTNSAQKLNSFSSRVNASSMGPTETRRSASPSPGIKRSESPALDPANRLRSPSPAPSNSKNNTANRNKSVPACLSKRCASPVKQITMSELKSSREGKPAVAMLRRQASVESEGCDSDTVKSSESGITIDKISTMSLGEFKSLLNSALSVPHSTESQGSLDSPRSQSSADSYKNSQFSKEKRTSVTRNTHNVTGANSGFSSSSTSSDKPKRSPTSTVVRSVNSPASRYAQTPNSGTNVRTKTPSSDSAKTARIVTKRSNFSKTLQEHSKTESSPFLDSQPKILSSTYQNYSQSSLNSEGSSVRLNNTSSLPSRCSSQSSFKSNDSLCETESCASSDLLRVETTDSLLNYTRSNSYTPTADRDKWAEPRSEIRACSEPKEVVKSDTVSEKHPLNVGYARFSHEDDAVLSPTYQFDEELSKIESELKKYASGNDNIENEEPVRKPQPSMRRPSTPSLIPRPATPKMSRKLSLTTDSENHVVDKQSHFMGRPPTAKHSNVVENSSIRSADAGKGKAYKDIFQSKRSKTPSPGNVSTNSISDNVRRCTTPGPNMSLKSTLSATSATVTRESLNQTLKLSKDASSLEHDEAKTADQSIRTKPGSSSGQRDLTERRNSVPSRSLNRQSSTKDSETVIMVNRTDAGHSLTVEDQAKPPHKQSAKRPMVLARARTENVRSRAQTRTNNGISRQRPQSVEPRQLIPRANLTTVASEQTTGMNSHRSGDGSDSIYNRTQEWVQTATEQTSKVQKMKQVNPVRRRAMTPNSFDIGIERDEPRSLDEIKAALTLPVNGLNRIEIDTEDLDAPPEDPEMYATMEKLFNELRKQELKASVNETPGSNIIPGRLGKSKSKSSSSANDEEASLNSNKNIENNRSNVSLSTGSSNVISPSVTKKTSSDLSVSKPTTGSQPLRNSSSRSTNSSSSSLTQPRTTTLKSAPPRPASPSMNRPAQTTRPPSPRTYKNVQPARPASPGINRNVQPTRPASPGINKNVQPARPASPSINKIVQPERPASPSMNKRSQPQRPASPSVTRSTNPPRPASPRTTVTTESSRSHIQRPASPHLSPSPSKTLVTASRSLQTSQNSIKHSTASQKPRQPPRPASTPPKPSRANGRPSVSGARDDTEESLGNDKENSDGASLISKLKQIINVKPRKDKAEGVKQKSRIPAPKSLASAGRSRSFTNLASVGRSMSLPSETENINGHLDFSYTESEMNRVNIENDITEGLNVTISGKSEVPKLKMAMPLTTGRATVIRKESIEKNKNPPRLIRAVSVERNIGDLRSDFQFYREGEYV